MSFLHLELNKVIISVESKFSYIYISRCHIIRIFTTVLWCPVSFGPGEGSLDKDEKIVDVHKFNLA